MAGQWRVALFVFGSLWAAHAVAKTWVVCPAATQSKGCAFTGNSAIQRAIDRASPGDTVLLKAGTYTPERYADIAFGKYTVRGYVTLDRKSISLRGEPGAILDGEKGPAASGIVVNGGEVRLSGIVVRNFRAVDPEDDIYDGSGIYIIDSNATVHDVTIERFVKMGLAARGSANVTASDVKINNGYVGVLLGESAQLRLCNAVVKDNHAAGVAAYSTSSAGIFNSVFDGNLDDGLFAVADATLYATNSLILRNTPYAVRVMDRAHAVVSYSVLSGNPADAFSPEGTQNVRFDKVTAEYVASAALEGDPWVKDGEGRKSRIGLAPVSGCTG